MKCWGGNFYGQLGQGDTTERGDGSGESVAVMVPVVLGSNCGTGSDPCVAEAVSAGFYHSCAVMGTGDVKCWGDNGSGQLGQDDTTDRGDDAGEMGDNLLPVDLGRNCGDGTQACAAGAVSVGSAHSCVVGAGEVKCWGGNGSGQLGQGDTAFRGAGPILGESVAAMLPVDLGKNCGGGGAECEATAIVVGSSHSCAVVGSFQMKCWGWNLTGQLGLGDSLDRGDESGEMGNDLPLLDLGSAREVAAGAQTTCAVSQTGGMKCWGNGAYGVLGQGDIRSRGWGDLFMASIAPIVNLEGVTVPGVPSVPSVTVDALGVEVSWSAPSDDGGGSVTGYVLESSTDGGGSWSQVAVTTEPSYAADFAAGVAVQFRVAATNVYGTGAASAASSSVTPSTTTTTTSTTVPSTTTLVPSTTTTTTPPTTSVPSTTTTVPVFDPCPSGGHPFTDVAVSSFAFVDIGCIFQLGITTGTSASTYGPSQTVTREQMGAFLARLWRALGNECPSGGHPFTDVAVSSFAFVDIGCIFQLGITTGTSASTYGPSQTVTREQMGAFLARLARAAADAGG